MSSDGRISWRWTTKLHLLKGTERVGVISRHPGGGWFFSSDADRALKSAGVAATLEEAKSELLAQVLSQTASTGSDRKAAES